MSKYICLSWWHLWWIRGYSHHKCELALVKVRFSKCWSMIRKIFPFFMLYLHDDICALPLHATFSANVMQQHQWKYNEVPQIWLTIPPTTLIMPVCTLTCLNVFMRHVYVHVPHFACFLSWKNACCWKLLPHWDYGTCTNPARGEYTGATKILHLFRIIWILEKIMA